MSGTSILGRAPSNAGFLAQIKAALGLVEAHPAEERVRISRPEDIRVSDLTLSIGPSGHEVATVSLGDLHGVLLSPVKGEAGIVDAIFRTRKRSGRLSRQYAGTFRTNTPAFTKLESTLKAYRL